VPARWDRRSYLGRALKRGDPHHRIADLPDTHVIHALAGAPGWQAVHLGLCPGHGSDPGWCAGGVCRIAPKKNQLDDIDSLLLPIYNDR
jgi:hypothetical protein